MLDRKSTRLNSSHVEISYAVFCLKKKKEAVRFGLQDTFAAVLPLSYVRAVLGICRGMQLMTVVYGGALHQHLPDVLFFFNDTATTEIYTLSLHDALPI